MLKNVLTEVDFRVYLLSFIFFINIHSPIKYEFMNLIISFYNLHLILIIKVTFIRTYICIRIIACPAKVDNRSKRTNILYIFI